uniref:Uncharacterized protein n=1 Tax=Utricularia reniformis TaxID=192314 RepID=A0A1Y0AZ45_9LAMI|nr:hypothetical protein AEK19_MT2041 [Utricularia reniformis]ART30427.1 hypothetical protein AEK19_MT2041 [Utricularia reniformis]
MDQQLNSIDPLSIELNVWKEQLQEERELGPECLMLHLRSKTKNESLIRAWGFVKSNVEEVYCSNMSPISSPQFLTEVADLLTKARSSNIEELKVL